MLEEGQRTSNSCSVRMREDCLSALKIRLTASSVAGMLRAHCHPEGPVPFAVDTTGQEG